MFTLRRAALWLGSLERKKEREKCEKRQLAATKYVHKQKAAAKSTALCGAQSMQLQIKNEK